MHTSMHTSCIDCCRYLYDLFYILKRICTDWKSYITFLLLIFLKFRRPFPHCVLTETISLLNSKFEDSIKFYSNQDQSFFAWFKSINHSYATISFLINTKSPLNCRLIFNCLLQLKNLLLKVWTIGYAGWMKIRYLQQCNSLPSFPIWLKFVFQNSYAGNLILNTTPPRSEDDWGAV